MQNRLPDSFRPLMWSYEFDRIDPQTNKKTVIVQAINYGTLAHWRWLRETYGTTAVRDILASIPATEIRPQARRLASLIFGVRRFNYAPRGTH